MIHTLIHGHNVNTLANSGNKYPSNKKYQYNIEIYQDFTYFALHVENKQQQPVYLFQEFGEIHTFTKHQVW